jgi:glycosyltransferase involved in cell wall biosynthesis
MRTGAAGVARAIRLQTGRRLVRTLARRLGRQVVYGVPAVLLGTSLVAAWLGGSWWSLTSAITWLAVLLAVAVRDSRINRIMVHDLRRRLSRAEPRSTGSARRLAGQTWHVTPRGGGTGPLDERLGELETDLHRTRRLLALTLADLSADPAKRAAPDLPDDLVPLAVSAMMERGDALDAHALAAATGTLAALPRAEIRTLREELRRRGYLNRALEVARRAEQVHAEDRDEHARRRLAGEIAVLSGSFTLTVRDEPGQYVPQPGRILHLVGHSLPDSQVGYTLRTHHLAVAQRASGLEPHVATQMGVSHDGDSYAREELDGITYHRIPGPGRGEVSLDRWLRAHAQRVANLVRVLRPAALHAASDFINAQTAVIVGKPFGIPVVYESRGFWEETWLSRTASQYGWDLQRLEATYGLPEAYRWRRETEDRLRQKVDHVVTLDKIMADRIEAGGVPRDHITVVPNAVSLEHFPVVERDQQLAAHLGIAEDAVTIGYVSSLVEYEGIGTLIAAYAHVKRDCPTAVRLVIVGDGPMRDQLTAQAQEFGLDDVVFTGRVAHGEVLSYYSLIDIFVVPRRPAEVCHLVTPLKPFEAFATGRAVVMSNVRALAAIASQSGAADLFQADDPVSLARVLRDLVADPQRRRDLAVAGAEWVRAAHTWQANAQRYLAVYELIGAVVPGTYGHLLFDPADVDLDKLRRDLERRPSLPFEVLCTADSWAGADDIMRRGWSLSPHPPTRLDRPINWTTIGADDRSWSFHLHAWDFMGPVLRAFAETGYRRYLEWCVDRAVSWADQFNHGEALGTMAWYDMALGLRGHRLAYLTEWALRTGSAAKTLATLLRCVKLHQQHYVASAAFNPSSNHGLYVALGELALARRLRMLPNMDKLERQARERLAVVAETQFASDGGHLEHSPDYHRMVLTTFLGAIKAGLVDDNEVRARIARAEEALGWFIQPNGELAQVGDSSATSMRSKHSLTSCQTTEFLISQGERGAPGHGSLFVLPKSGYAVVRSPQPTGVDDHGGASYLLLAAGFHSRTHKHADDLTVTWFDLGSEILIDAGRYGYDDPLPRESPLRKQGFFYAAPERQHVESTRAHNTLETDGRDHQRRGRQPYGSALVKTEERDGHFRLIAQVDHGRWHHHREIILCPGQWLYVVDTVHSQDRAAHDYRLWWNFPAEVRMHQVGSSALRVDLASPETLHVCDLAGGNLITPVRGQRDPLRGWRSRRDREFTPAWSTGFEVIAVRDWVFRSMFHFGEPAHDEPDHPFRRPDPHSRRAMPGPLR